MNIENIKKAKEMIKNADAIFITAGAGMGVDSGLPDFRGNEGFWNEYPIIKKLGLSFENMATPKWFEANPSLAWAFYGHRLNLYRKTIPHKGFQLLKDLVKTKKDYFIFTSNVDGQFQKAGFESIKVNECHGTIHHFQCTTICGQEIYDAKGIDIEVDIDKFTALNTPKCPNCGKIARPNIVMFGDCFWKNDRTVRQALEFKKFAQRVHINKYKLVIIEIGGGKDIPTVRKKSERIAKILDGFVIRINPRDYDIDESIGVGIALGGLEALEKILE